MASSNELCSEKVNFTQGDHLVLSATDPSQDTHNTSLINVWTVEQLSDLHCFKVRRAVPIHSCLVLKKALSPFPYPTHHCSDNRAWLMGSGWSHLHASNRLSCPWFLHKGITRRNNGRSYTTCLLVFYKSAHACTTGVQDQATKRCWDTLDLDAHHLCQPHHYPNLSVFTSWVSRLQVSFCGAVGKEEALLLMQNQTFICSSTCLNETGCGNEH